MATPSSHTHTGVHTLVPSPFCLCISLLQSTSGTLTYRLLLCLVLRLAIPQIFTPFPLLSLQSIFCLCLTFVTCFTSLSIAHYIFLLFSLHLFVSLFFLNFSPPSFSLPSPPALYISLLFFISYHLYILSSSLPSSSSPLSLAVTGSIIMFLTARLLSSWWMTSHEY